MKPIHLTKFAIFTLRLDGTIYDTHQIREEFRQYSDNVQEVILSTAAIENMLKTLVRDYFVDDKSKREFFRNIITSTDFFSFAPAKRTAIEILRTVGMPANELEELEKLLNKVMDYRNSLAHGEPLLDHDKFLCRYYKAKRCEVEITDEYWDKVKKTFDRTHEMLNAYIKE